jgi:hypothetical protein
MRVLVTGGRGFQDFAAVCRALDALNPRPTYILEGGAPGADELANEWARLRAVPVETFLADWTMHGNAAGPLRNARMLAEGKPDLVVAFFGRAGTLDMVKRAERAGVPVIKVGW